MVVNMNPTLLTEILLCIVSLLAQPLFLSLEIDSRPISLISHTLPSQTPGKRAKPVVYVPSEARTVRPKSTK